MENRERVLSISLILHLVLSLLSGAVISVSEGLTDNGQAIKLLSLVLVIAGYAFPIFLYCKKTGFVPFVSPLNAPCMSQNGVSAKEKTFLFLFGISLTVAVLNVVGQLTDALFSVFGQTVANDTSVLQAGTLYSFIKTVCLAALVEEILFRGAILHAFSDRRNGTRIVISAAAFALMHGNIRQFFYAFAAGLIIATFTVMTGSLSFSVLLHFGSNLVTFIFSLLKERFDGKTYTWVSLITISVFVIVAALCAVWWFLKMREKGKAPVKTEEGRYPIALPIYLLAAAAISVIGSF